MCFFVMKKKEMLIAADLHLCFCINNKSCCMTAYLVITCPYFEKELLYKDTTR